MKKHLKFQSIVSCKINGVLQTYKSNELVIEIVEPKKRKTIVVDAPYEPPKKKYCCSKTTLCRLICFFKHKLK